MSFATFKACPSSVHSITTLKDVAAITVMWNRTNRSRRWRKSAAPNWTSDDEDSNWGPPQGRHTVAKPFTVALEVVTENEAPSIKQRQHSTQHDNVVLHRSYQLLVELTNLCCQQYLDLQDEGPLSPSAPSWHDSVWKSPVLDYDYDCKNGIWHTGQ